jgi:hypothetical protein
MRVRDQQRDQQCRGDRRAERSSLRHPGDNSDDNARSAAAIFRRHGRRVFMPTFQALTCRRRVPCGDRRDDQREQNGKTVKCVCS